MSHNYYPERGVIAASEHIERMRGTENWQLAHDTVTGRRVLLFPPGWAQFITIGMLGILTAAATILFFNWIVFAESSHSFKASILVAGTLVLVNIHVALMFRVSRGYFYAQHDLATYLSVLRLWAGALFTYALLESENTPITVVVGMGFAASLLMHRLAKGIAFTVAAEHLRLRRLCAEEIQRKAPAN